MNKLVCRIGREEDIPVLKSLYAEAFPEDPLDYTEAFFALVKPETMACVGEVDGRIVCALYLLPALAVSRDNRAPVRYLYAGGTFPDCRRQGHYSALLRFAADHVAAIGESAIYLRPANVSLLSYYRSHGYVKHVALRLSSGGRNDGYELRPREPFLTLFQESGTPNDDDEIGCVLLPITNQGLDYCYTTWIGE